jgi:hypothetical protein
LQHFRGRRACCSSGMGTKKSDKWVDYSHRPAQNQTTSWLMHSWNIFGAWTNHGQTQIHKIHKTHHSPNLGEATTFPLTVLFVPSHGPCTQMSFCLGTPKLGVLKYGLPRLWRPITCCANFRLKWGLKQSYSPCWELSKDMWHTTYALVNQGNYQLLMVKSQTANLTPDHSQPFFGHNLCFKYPNGSCELILDI